MTKQRKQPAETAVRDIRRRTRRKFSPEEKFRIVLEGLRGEQNVSDLCRREGIVIGTCLDQRHRKKGILTQPRRENGARGASSDDDDAPPLSFHCHLLQAAAAQSRWVRRAASTTSGLERRW